MVLYYKFGILDLVHLQLLFAAFFVANEVPTKNLKSQMA